MKKSLILSVLVIFMAMFLVGANQLGIDSNANYMPGEKANFKITLYDDSLNVLPGTIDYEIRNFYSDVMASGKISSGEILEYVIPENAVKGYWEIYAKSNDLEKSEVFNVLDGEKMDIKLEGDNLVISNLGNTPISSKQISISIGDNPLTALVSLEIGQVKKIKLTAPTQEYTIKVSDGTEKNTFEVSGVTLTGNVVGLESNMGKSFWQSYLLVGVFLIAVIGAFMVVSVLRIRRK
jgi:hypothetical protein